MKFDRADADCLPEILSLDDVMKLCHIGNVAARYYIKSGLLPCSSSGKKTRCYRIRKDDLLDFVGAYEAEPEKFIIPQEWRDHGKISTARRRPVISLPPPEMRSQVVSEYYKHKVDGLPDLLLVMQVVMLTGYNRHTVARWLRQGKVRAYCTEPKIWFFKESVVGFLSSDEYNAIPNKSKTHADDIKTIYKKIHS